MSAATAPQALPAGDSFVELRVVNDWLEYRLAGHGEWRRLAKLVDLRGRDAP